MGNACRYVRGPDRALYPENASAGPRNGHCMFGAIDKVRLDAPRLWEMACNYVAGLHAKDPGKMQEPFEAI